MEDEVLGRGAEAAANGHLIGNRDQQRDSPANGRLEEQERQRHEPRHAERFQDVPAILGDHERSDKSAGEEYEISQRENGAPS